MTKTISGFVDVPEPGRESFEQALPEHSRLTNLEPGCHYFKVTAHETIAGRWLVEETFENDAAYEAHMVRTRETEWYDITKNIKRTYKT